MRKLVELIVGVILSLTIVGFIPALLVALAIKFNVVGIAFIVLAVILMFYEICKM